MTRYSSIYELEAELKAQGFRTVPELDIDIPANDDTDDPYLHCDDGDLYSYPAYKFYIIHPKAN